jgi:hypothetical protein
MFCLDSNGCLKGDRGGSLGNGPFPFCFCSTAMNSGYLQTHFRTEQVISVTANLPSDTL